MTQRVVILRPVERLPPLVILLRSTCSTASAGFTRTKISLARANPIREVFCKEVSF